MKRTSRWSRAQCAAKLRILSDPTRLSVLELLLAGPRQVGEINAVLKIEQSLLSHHLKTLREAGLVKAARDGKAVRYCLAEQVEAPERGRVINLGCCLVSFETDDPPAHAPLK